MKKRLAALTLCAALTLSFAAGCGEDSSGSGSDSSAGAAQSENPADPESDSGANSSDKARTVAQTDTQRGAVCSIDGKTFYNNGKCILDITNPDAPVFSEIAREKSDKAFTELSELRPDRSIVSGNKAVSCDEEDRGKIFEYDLSDLKNVRKKVLYDVNSWNSAVQAKADKTYSAELIGSISDNIMYYCDNWVDGGDGYVYFKFVSPGELFNDHVPQNYLVGRFALDGKGMELLSDDIRASSVTFKDGYLYYADCGYTVKGLSADYSYDKSRIGIYKVRPDGSGKQKLVSISSVDEKYSHTENLAGRLEVVGDYLYYIARNDSSDRDNSYLYRLPLGGGEPQQLTKESVCDYYVDTRSGTLFYYTGELYGSSKDVNKFCSVKLDGGEKKILFMSYENNYPPTLGVYGDYVYFMELSGYTGYQLVEKSEEYDDSAPSGMRYSLSAGKMEYLQAYAIAEYEENSSGYKTIKSYGSVSTKWIEKKSTSAKDGAALY